MPINPSALSSPEPDPTPMQTTMDETGAAIAPVETTQDSPKRTRRNKAQMIADAVIPGDAEMVEVKDLNTGAKVERAWREAVGLVESGAVEFVDKSLKYAVLKAAQLAAAPAFEQNDPNNPYLAAAGDPQPVATESLEQPQFSPQPGSVPEGAALGDEVRVGSETYRVGHGGVLTSSVVAEGGTPIKAKRRWQRELGAGLQGPWESVALTQTSEQRPIFDEKSPEQADPMARWDGKDPVEVVAILEERLAAAHREANNGNGAPEGITVQTEKLLHTQEEIAPGVVKVGTGILEKIGLPDYSSFQIGPITMSRTVIDDGRRSTHHFSDGRTGEVITAAVEMFDLMDNTVEFVAARFRGQLIPFLQSTGALKQPVS